MTIGLAFLVALLQTTWHRRGDEAYLRLIRSFGALLVINIANRVVSGLVQEFQFGMNWSAYSRYVGDVFGAPLAIHRRDRRRGPDLRATAGRTVVLITHRSEGLDAVDQIERLGRGGIGQPGHRPQRNLPNHIPRKG